MSLMYTTEYAQDLSSLYIQECYGSQLGMTPPKATPAFGIPDTFCQLLP